MLADFFVQSIFSSVGMIQVLVWLSVLACALATTRSRAWRRFAVLALMAWAAWSLGAIVMTPASPREDDLLRTIATMATTFAVAVVPAALLFGFLVKRGTGPMTMVLAALPLLVVQAALSVYLMLVVGCSVGGHCVS